MSKKTGSAKATIFSSCRIFNVFVTGRVTMTLGTTLPWPFFRKGKIMKERLAKGCGTPGWYSVVHSENSETMRIDPAGVEWKVSKLM